ncbi:MAG: hypothetical protein AB4368_13745 [Xenococcaceae cyanobacterium]
MSYFDVLIRTEKSIRQLAKEMGIAYETLRDRLNRNTPSEKQRNGVPIETIEQANQLIKSGKSIRATAKLVGVSKSHLHRLVKKYRSMFNEEDN